MFISNYKNMKYKRNEFQLMFEAGKSVKFGLLTSNSFREQKKATASCHTPNRVYIK